MKITEEQIKSIVLSVLKEATGMRPLQPKEKFTVQPDKTPGDMIKLLSKAHGVPPEDFTYDRYSRKICYDPRKRPKVERQKFSKPEDMSVKDYYSSIVLKVNPKIKEDEEKYDDEIWMPVKNVGRYFKGQADYSFYEVSNHARLRIIDFEDAAKSRILSPYPAPTRRAMQFHLNSNDENGKKLNTCPDVKYIVADAFIENFDPQTQVVIHKNGDWSNNDIDNLAVIDKKGSRSRRLDETIRRVIREYLH